MVMLTEALFKKCIHDVGSLVSYCIPFANVIRVVFLVYWLRKNVNKIINL